MLGETDRKSVRFAILRRGGLRLGEPLEPSREARGEHPAVRIDNESTVEIKVQIIANLVFLRAFGLVVVVITFQGNARAMKYLARCG